MAEFPDPIRLGQALSELIALRGYARREANRELQLAWANAAGEAVASQSRATEIKRGVLHVLVANSALLSELVGYFRKPLVERLKSLSPELRIKDVKFRLDSSADKRSSLTPPTPQED